MRTSVLHSSLRLALLLLLLAASIGRSAVYTVTIPADGGPGTLRDAINAANATPGLDTILFALPPGATVIMPLSQLPVLTDLAGVLIDGLSQTGAMAGSNPPLTTVLIVELDGATAGPAHGLWIQSSNNIIRGLVIRGFRQDGIRIQATPHGTTANLVQACFIGVNALGIVPIGNGIDSTSLYAGVNILAPPSPTGVLLYAFDNIVQENLISGNTGEGVSISSCPPSDVYANVVVDNLIGTDIAGNIDIGNTHDGVYIGEAARDNLVDLNLISGNDYEGVAIVGYIDPPTTQWSTTGNIVSRNVIGMNLGATAPVPNSRDGVSIGLYGPTWRLGYAPHNTIIDNTIAWNHRNGIVVFEHSFSNTNADQILIARNKIFDNALLGIDLGDDGVTLSDAGDPDSGANQQLNFPIIDSARQQLTGMVSVWGRLAIDTDPSQSSVELFVTRPDPSGYGEGAMPLGVVAPLATGAWFASVAGVSTSDTLTATVLDLAGNTSEFARNVPVLPASTTGIGEPPVVARWRIVVEPNPFSDATSLNIDSPIACTAQLNVVDVLGRLAPVRSDLRLKQGRNTITIGRITAENESLSPGIYLFQLEAAGNRVSTTAIVVR